jgi:hypothetical protein
MENKIIAAIAVGVVLAVALIVIIVLAATGAFDSNNNNNNNNSNSNNNKLLFNTYLLNPDDSYVFTDSNGVETVNFGCQALVDSIYEEQGPNVADSPEFKPARVLLMLAVGTHLLNIRLGYYTVVTGLGTSRNDVVVQGSISIPNNEDPCIGSLDSFFRSMSNLTIQVPDGEPNYFSASQASPIRNVRVEGDLALSRFQGGCGDNPGLGGYSSGGFMADMEITNDVDFATQQQFFTRNSTIGGSVTAGAWNLFFVGCVGTIPVNECVVGIKGPPAIPGLPLYTNEPIVTGKIAGALGLTRENGFFVIVKPTLVTDSSGLSLGDTVFERNVTTVHPGTPIEEINALLEIEGLHLIFAPGQYFYSQPITLVHSNTLILGLGFATIHPTAGNVCLLIKDGAVGCRVTGLMIEAGEQTSEALIRVGETIKGAGDPNNPTILSDMFPRVGGPTDTASAITMFEVNQNETVIDHTWCWRADHDSNGVRSGLGPTKAQVQFGLVVNGDNVRGFGIFSEHTLQECVQWNGDNGRLKFMQCELPYDVGSEWDFPGLKVTGSGFQGSGIGIYSFFARKWSNNTPANAPMVTSGVVVPTDAEISRVFTIFLNGSDDPQDGGNGEITHVINGTGSVSGVDEAGIAQWCNTSSPGGSDCIQCPTPSPP